MSRYAMCPDCGHRMKRIDEETYYCKWCAADNYEDENETLSVNEAALIWASNGKDEDYTFGYSEEELEDAL